MSRNAWEPCTCARPAVALVAAVSPRPRVVAPTTRSRPASPGTATSHASFKPAASRCHSPDGARPDVARDLRGRAAVGAGDQGRSPDAPHAEVARRARLRRLQQRPVAVGVRDRADRGVGRRRCAARHRGGRARCHARDATARRHDPGRRRTRGHGALRRTARCPTGTLLAIQPELEPKASVGHCGATSRRPARDRGLDHATSTRSSRPPTGCGCRSSCRPAASISDRGAPDACALTPHGCGTSMTNGAVNTRSLR